jgi:COP9 signalosome complex subunit 3
MDLLKPILEDFPSRPQDLEGLSTEGLAAYDAAIKKHISQLTKVLEKAPSSLWPQLGTHLESLEMETVDFIILLEAFLNQPGSRQLSSGLLEKTLQFLMTFDWLQIRYVDQQMLGLIDVLRAGQLYPRSVVVEILASVIQRLDPAGTVLTSTHLHLVQMAVEENQGSAVLGVIDKDITFFPNMGGPEYTGPLCDARLNPTAYMSGFSHQLKSASVMEYHMLCGLIYIKMKDWSKARISFERVIVHPSKDRSVSKMMGESYKKWILLGLLELGRTPKAPTYMASYAKNAFNTLAGPYTKLASLFETDHAAEFKEEVEKNQALLEEDGNTELLSEVTMAYQKHQILKLRQIFVEVAVSTIRATTYSAATGLPLQTDAEALALVQDMIATGFLQGELAPGENSEVFLRFQDDSVSLSERDFAIQLEKSKATVLALTEDYNITNERLSEHKEYTKYLVREHKRMEKETPDAAIGFENSIEDEDLMVGIANSG